MKKRLSLLLVIAMLISLIPAIPAAAVYNTNYFSISFSKLVYGEKPYYAPDYISKESSPEGYKQQVTVDTSAADGFTNGVKWSRKSGSSYVTMSSGETFQTGSEYQLSVRMKPVDGFQFPTSGSSITAYINGKRSSVNWVSQQLIIITAAVTVKEAEVIDELDLWFLGAPETGENPDYGGGSSTYFNSPENMQWKDTTTNTVMTESSAFQAGHSYSVSFRMNTTSCYFLKGTRTNPQFTVTEWPEGMTGYDIFIPTDGEFAHGIRTVDLTVYFGKVTPVSYIQKVTIKVTTPVAWQTPSYNVTVSGTGCKNSGYTDGEEWSNGVCWVGVEEGGALFPSDMFVPGGTYKVLVEVQALNGYRFQDDVTVTINGKPADNVFFKTNQSIIANAYFEAAEVSEEGWVQKDGKWYYYEDGMLATGWQQVEGKWYYLGTDGVMRTGWQQVSGKWYLLGSDGAMKTGWQKYNNKWYLLGPDGVMKTGWQKSSGKWYLLGMDGVMKTGWQKSSGNWYLLGADGVMKTGWQKDGGNWYYLGTDGVMVTGWQSIGGNTYCFKSSGIMCGNEWFQGYWFNASGTWTYKHKGSWHQDSKGWWFGDTSGWYAKNETLKIDNKMYTFGADGYMK